LTAKDKPGRVLGLDVGERRIGVAVSDPERRFALPLQSIDRKAGDTMEAIASYVREDEIEEVVVGLPLSLSGESGPQAESAIAIARDLERRLHLPVHMWDERLSTREALGRVEGPRRGQRRERGRGAAADTDALAASIILQAFLDGHRQGTEEHE
jgi:putative Holliday junction resolvase